MAEEKGRSRRRFVDEFKCDAAALVIDTGRPVAHAAPELGVYESSLGLWMAQERDRGATSRCRPPSASGGASSSVKSPICG